MQRCRRVHSPDHEITLTAATGLSHALARLGEAELARVLGEDTLQRCRQVLGLNHPLTLHVTQAASGRLPTPGDDAAADRPSRPL